MRTLLLTEYDHLARITRQVRACPALKYQTSAQLRQKDRCLLVVRGAEDAPVVGIDGSSR